MATREFAIAVRNRRSDYSGMSRLIEITSQLPVRNLDYWERLIREEYSSIVDSATRTPWEKFRRVKKRPLTYIDVFSWDGYRREKALRTLTDAAPNSFFLAFALRRLNDWVPEVRMAAREKLPELTVATNPEYVVEAVTAAFIHWGSWGRMQNSERQVLLDIATSKHTIDAIKNRIISASSGSMATLLSQLGRSSAFDIYLSEISSKAIQPSVRAKAYRSLMEGKVKWLEGRKWEWTDIKYCKGRMVPIVSERPLSSPVHLLDVLNAAAIDKSPSVRKVAAEVLISKLVSPDDELIALANRFASDSFPSVSERGRFALKVVNGFN